MNFLRRLSVPTAIFAGMRHVRQRSPLFATALTTPMPSARSIKIASILKLGLRERFLASSLFTQPKPDESAENDDQKVQQKWTYTDRAYQQVAKHRLHANGVDDPTDLTHDLELEGAAYDENDEYDTSTCIEVHKAVLVAASPYFAKKFEKVDAWSNPSNGDGTQCSVMEFDHAIGVLDELKKRVNGNEALSKAAIYWLNANWPLLKHDVQDENGDDAKTWDALEYMLWYAELSDDYKVDVEQTLLKERKLEHSSTEEFKLSALHKSRQVDELLEDSKAYRAKLDALRAQKRELRQQ